ncbi:CPBP family intramembrane glutamic endopeptidase [Robertkochia aurantiaca]|uniref:CPBP family intramembrane glutamic endopeptidase n=1 Tax=Robertkochia aurantiaca TaxID=2873700 RepID=UPI001CCC774A|nr:type II CAAX endopeptidase family protein [Robertkochia sp. 3YJGBD-33]
MLFITIMLLISWVVLRLTGNNLKVLGLIPDLQTGLQFLKGFLLFAFMAAVYFSGIVALLQADVILNENYGAVDFLNGAWWTLRSVLMEEVMFRGVLLYLGIRYLGPYKAIILSAIVFGIWHWFSYEVIGDVSRMISVFVLTGTGGLLFGYAYYRTGSLLLPIGLHFGWNLVTITIFSQGPLGEQLLITTTENSLGSLWSILSFLYQSLLVPLFGFLLVKNFAGGGRVMGHKTVW